MKETVVITITPDAKLTCNVPVKHIHLDQIRELDQWVESILPKPWNGHSDEVGGAYHTD